MQTSNWNEPKTRRPMVFVADDDPQTREAIASLLKSIGVETQLFSRANDLLVRLEELTPDSADFPNCLILDVRMPAMGGLEAQTRLAQAKVQIPIIFVSAYGDVIMSVHAMKAGAYDFLPKPFRGQTLLDTVLSALAHDQRSRGLDRFRRELSDRYASLTARERAILRLIGRGLLNKQIAWELGVSEITVKVNRAQLMRKMKAHSVAELIKMEDRLSFKEPHSELSVDQVGQGELPR
ncbi:response regulator transcription factor [Paraburkholderia rhizosphaerae]|uniref:FixJ family two-component response regulator n=1 Tax=Paraburkholderia rhizosphaerae TaxID=480658 RepID=A0A4R8LC96_9BURK|nr:response regulator [Paraburkholderia rhizosphaerae]TDY40573.1 FixJ family two-component response regulator [Paraburkholderia rhizosphaerae]